MAGPGWSEFFKNQASFDDFATAEMYRQRFHLEGVKIMVQAINSLRPRRG